MKNIKHMKKILTIIGAWWMSVAAWAVMATPEPITMTQGDGSTITLKLVGDEFHHYYTLMDGTPVRCNKAGMWVKDASVVAQPAAAAKARRVAQEQLVSGSFPLKGSPKSVVILVNFKDVSFQYTRDDFDHMLNKSGYDENGGVGSCRDYFIACSDSIFQPKFDCYGPVTLSQEMAYYGGNTSGHSSAHAGQMIVEACNRVADDLGVDFAQYDTDGDGNIDNVFVYYAGHNEAEGGGKNTVWPHRSIINSGEKVSGKRIYDYACTSELRGSSGNSMCGIGTFCHEFSHVLGLPDYYDTDPDDEQYTIGTWDLMCSGNYNGNGKTPPSYTAGERFQLGWAKPIQLKDAGMHTLPPVESSNTIYLISEGDHNLSFDEADPSEYWLLENRQHVGWDEPASALPATGMLIWHIDYNAGAWGGNRPNNSKPMRYDLIEADGVKGYAAASDPFPGSKKVEQFTPVLHNGTIVEQPLLNIAEDGENITFMFKSNDFMFLPTDFPLLESTYNPDTKKSYYPGSKMKVVGENMIADGAVTIAIEGSGFKISEDSLNWRSSIDTKANADGTLDTDIYVRYGPNKQVCDIQRGTISVRQEGKVGTFPVRGICPRPTLINTPEVTSIEEVTPTSFKMHWKPEKDAEQYFVTMYHLEHGSESRSESFEDFDDPDVVDAAGWTTSFYRTTTKAKEEGAMSMWFKENNEYMISPIYPLPVVELSIWLNAPATTDSEVGWIILSGYSSESVDIIDTIKITKSTKKYTYEHSFNASDGYCRFKMEYLSQGGEGTCVDAFTTTFNQKTVYTYKDRERTIEAQEGDIAEDYAVFYAYDLEPETVYYVQLQCAEAKGCKENVSPLSVAYPIETKKGEGVDSKHLTLDYDIYYDKATHVVYLPTSLEGGSVNVYSVEGELIATIPVGASHHIVPLPDSEFRRGAVYIVKYLPNDKMKRKNPWIKILFE